MADLVSAKPLWLALGFACAFAGLAWLALAMEGHWAQVRGTPAAPPRTVRTLRAMGAAALLVSLALCLVADRASMAALVWVMQLAVGAVAVALLLAWRPRWLAPLLAGCPRVPAAD